MTAALADGVKAIASGMGFGGSSQLLHDESVMAVSTKAVKRGTGSFYTRPFRLGWLGFDPSRT